MENTLSDCEFYCLSYNNQNNLNTMKEKFKNLNIQCKYYFGVSHNDIRIPKYESKFNKRQLSITYGHLDIINDFYFNSNKNFAIICEDDIKLHKNFKEIITQIVSNPSIHNLDLLLLSYLLPYKFSDININNIF